MNLKKLILDFKKLNKDIKTKAEKEHSHDNFYSKTEIDDMLSHMDLRYEVIEEKRKL